MKLCINCVHVTDPVIDGKHGQLRCDRPTGETSVIHGANELRKQPCWYERSGGILFSWFYGRCGKRGRFFKNRHGDTMRVERRRILPPPKSWSGSPTAPEPNLNQIVSFK